MDIKDFIAAMEEAAPPDLAEEYDEGRIGLIVSVSSSRGEARSKRSAVRSTPRRGL